MWIRIGGHRPSRSPLSLVRASKGRRRLWPGKAASRGPLDIGIQRARRLGWHSSFAGDFQRSNTQSGYRSQQTETVNQDSEWHLAGSAARRTEIATAGRARACRLGQKRPGWCTTIRTISKARRRRNKRWPRSPRAAEAATSADAGIRIVAAGKGHRCPITTARRRWRPSMMSRTMMPWK